MSALTPQNAWIVQILGGQSRVGGFNSHLLKFGGSTLLLDAGGAVTAEGQSLSSVPDLIRTNVSRIVLTHAHGDHFWDVVSYLKNHAVAILTSRWTRLIAEEYLNQNGFRRYLGNANFVEANQPTFDPNYSPSGWYEWGPSGSEIVVGLFAWPHSTPESRGLVVIHTPELGAFIWMIDLAEPDPANEASYIKVLRQIGSLGVVAVFVDSTAVGREQNHRPASEDLVRETFRQEINKTNGTVYFTCFSSDVKRIQAAAQEAFATGRCVCYIAGQSIRTAIGLACTNSGEQGQPYINGEAYFDKNTNRWFIQSIEGLPVVSLEEAIHWAENDPSKLIVFAAGTQAEGWEQADKAMDYVGDLGDEVVIASAMTRLVRYGLRPYRSLQSLKIQAGDTVIFSASEIPDYAETIAELKSAIRDTGAKVIDDYNATVHLSGHGDMSRYLVHLMPQVIIPIHGDRQKRELMGQAVQAVLPNVDILQVEDGQQINFSKVEFGQVTAAIEEIPGFAWSEPKTEPVPVEGSLTISIVVIKETGQLVGYDLWPRNLELSPAMENLVKELIDTHIEALFEAGGIIEEDKAHRVLGRIAQALIAFFRGSLSEARPYINVVRTQVSVSDLQRVFQPSLVRA